MTSVTAAQRSLLALLLGPAHYAACVTAANTGELVCFVLAFAIQRRMMRRAGRSVQAGPSPSLAAGTQAALVRAQGWARAAC